MDITIPKDSSCPSCFKSRLILRKPMCSLTIKKPESVPSVLLNVTFKKWEPYI